MSQSEFANLVGVLATLVVWVATAACVIGILTQPPGPPLPRVESIALRNYIDELKRSDCQVDSAQRIDLQIRCCIKSFHNCSPDDLFECLSRISAVEVNDVQEDQSYAAEDSSSDSSGILP